MREWKIRFGTAGTSDSFAAQGYKTSLDMPDAAPALVLKGVQPHPGLHGPDGAERL